MPQQFLVAIGAGLAAALLFFIPVKGTAFAMTIALFASLPLMIAGLAFSPAAALLGAVAGSLALNLGLVAFTEVSGSAAFVFSLFFAATAALPAWQLTRLTWLGRPAEDGETAGPDGLVWYPMGRLVAWMAGLGAAAAAAGFLFAVARWGSFDAFVTESAARLTPMVDAIFSRAGGATGLPGGLTSAELARAFVLLTAPVTAGWTVAALALNLWLAGRIAHVSQRLRRPWQDVPENLHLPRALGPLFLVCLGATLLGGAPLVLGAIGAAAIGVALALKGLAIIHAATRANAARGLLLALLYTAMLILFPLPLPLLAAVGLAAVFTAGGRPSPSPPSPKNQ
ncbi:MAG TPA: hypothetical protein VIL72_07435 [Beijerinckiaceae bacterium]|jgi:hypothetical protein